MLLKHVLSILKRSERGKRCSEIYLPTVKPTLYERNTDESNRGSCHEWWEDTLQNGRFGKRKANFQ